MTSSVMNKQGCPSNVGWDDWDFGDFIEIFVVETTCEKVGTFKGILRLLNFDILVESLVTETLPFNMRYRAEALSPLANTC